LCAYTCACQAPGSKSGNEEAALDDTKFDEFMGNDAGMFAATGEYDEDDKEADAVWEKVDDFMDERRRVWRRAILSCLVCVCVRRRVPGLHTSVLQRTSTPDEDNFSEPSSAASPCDAWLHVGAVAAASCALWLQARRVPKACEPPLPCCHR
jgi:hypothetical protein